MCIRVYISTCKRGISGSRSIWVALTGRSLDDRRRVGWDISGLARGRERAVSLHMRGQRCVCESFLMPESNFRLAWGREREEYYG